MNIHNTLIWLSIYLAIIYRNKSIKCNNIAPTESGQSDGTSTEPNVTPEVSKGVSTTSNEPIPVESGPNTSVPSPGSDNMTLYNDRELVSMIQLLNKLQLIDFVDLLANKLKSHKGDYDFKTDLTNFVDKTSIYRHPIILNITELLSTDEYEWETIDDKVVYTPKEGYGFKLVRYNITVLWHTTNINYYATKIECDHKNHTVTIHKLDGKIDEIQYTPEPQDTTALTTPESQQGSTIRHPTVLNISEIKNCDEYRWFVSNDIITCIANDKYGFKLVRQNKTVLWHTINRNNYSNVVECDNKNHTVTVYKLDKTKDKTDFQPEQRDKTKLITVDIEKRTNNEFYTYERRVELDVFAPVKPYLVNKIVNGIQPLWWFKDGTYPYEIEVTDKKNQIRNLVLYFRSKTIEFFDSGGDEIEPIITKPEEQKVTEDNIGSDTTGIGKEESELKHQDKVLVSSVFI
ncbi:hypothetical protein MACK_000418 [Theileria orientalis]|uniref:Uncharacterized protein n=1 Tax=Theileria orientalis TaxID=68886 RepID=A0A976QWI6_THEOR|nr:hypothetical protein MACK_000418 [Theileria orientalis]